MSIRSSRSGDTVVVGVEGQLIAGNRQQLRDAITTELDRGAKAFVIDFAETGYIDSAGLGALVSISKRVRESQATLSLTNLNDDLHTLFELTKLDTLFDLGPPEARGGGTVDDVPPVERSPRNSAATRRDEEPHARP
jgi:anti-sigma B factor antagonist